MCKISLFLNFKLIVIVSLMFSEFYSPENIFQKELRDDREQSGAFYLLTSHQMESGCR